jgi:sugar lactone lactonase YvrE
VVTIPLGGEWVQNPGFNANGIARTPDGRALIVVNSGTGALFRVDPATGVATAVDLGGESVPTATVCCSTAGRSTWCRTS